VVPDEKTGYHGLISLFVKHSYEFLIYKAQERLNRNENVGIRVNYVLDEFSSLPTIHDFPAMITAARSRNIRFNLFLQSKHQLKLRYAEESDTIMSNCENWIFLYSRELELLKEISELCGLYGGSNQRPVLTVTDLQRFDKNSGEALVLSGRSKPLITYLADINVFDKDHPKPVSYEEYVERKRIEIDFTLTDSMRNSLKESILIPPISKPMPRNGGSMSDNDFISSLIDGLKNLDPSPEKRQNEEGENNNDI
jgi:type IV secretion system protein VirD4